MKAGILKKQERSVIIALRELAKERPNLSNISKSSGVSREHAREILEKGIRKEIFFKQYVGSFMGNPYYYYYITPPKPEPLTPEKLKEIEIKRAEREEREEREREERRKIRRWNELKESIRNRDNPWKSKSLSWRPSFAEIVAAENEVARERGEPVQTEEEILRDLMEESLVQRPR